MLINDLQYISLQIALILIGLIVISSSTLLFVLMLRQHSTSASIKSAQVQKVTN